jgi:hypothetical protein
LLAETGWSYEESLGQLKEDVVAIADLLRVEETRKMVLVIEVRSLSPRTVYSADGDGLCSATSRSRSARRSNSVSTSLRLRCGIVS